MEIFCAYCNKRIGTKRPGKSKSSSEIKSLNLRFCSLSCRSRYFNEQSTVDKK